MQDVISILGVLGLSGLTVAIFTFVFDRKKERQSRNDELKFARYKCIIMLMLSLLQKEYGVKQLLNYRQDFKTKEDIEKGMEVEFLNSILFANK
jgi:hypothetical protein